ncbi:hypothetical protein KOR34_00670 [Posidoniimonas corsicana]|uniref:Uncharacterized protein n=1 Tax=Posidoniimonas corsicana TaxID=1938618 RepID=A0A5C5VBG9_9BACT|nr:hypothetical protein [Posidoniimonas corsicana]TWT35179.1 hypothetical protein KOR34_00670 [Posidoniimonas corsicana]
MPASLKGRNHQLPEALRELILGGRVFPLGKFRAFAASKKCYEGLSIHSDRLTALKYGRREQRRLLKCGLDYLQQHKPAILDEAFGHGTAELPLDVLADRYIEPWQESASRQLPADDGSRYKPTDGPEALPFGAIPGPMIFPDKLGPLNPHSRSDVAALARCVAAHWGLMAFEGRSRLSYDQAFDAGIDLWGVSFEELQEIFRREAIASPGSHWLWRDSSDPQKTYSSFYMPISEEGFHALAAGELDPADVVEVAVRGKSQWVFVGAHFGDKWREPAFRVKAVGLSLLHLASVAESVNDHSLHLVTHVYGGEITERALAWGFKKTGSVTPLQEHDAVTMTMSPRFRENDWKSFAARGTVQMAQGVQGFWGSWTNAVARCLGRAA